MARKKNAQTTELDEQATKLVVDSSDCGQNNSVKKKTTGATESIVSIFCYLGAFIAGAVVLKLSKQNRFIRFNAAQSTIYTLGLLVITALLHVIPLIGSLLSITVAIGGAALWGIMIIKATKHEDFRIPLVSFYADKLVDKIDQKVIDKNTVHK